MKKTLLQLAAALFSAALIISLWSPVGQSGNIWFALVPLLLLVRHVSVRRAFWLGGLVGLVSWVGQLWWMLALTDNNGPWYLVLPALLGLSAVLSVFVAAFAGLAAALRVRLSAEPGLGRIALATVLEPALWAGLECLRSNLFTGFGSLFCCFRCIIDRTAVIIGAITDLLFVRLYHYLHLLYSTAFGSVIFKFR